MTTTPVSFEFKCNENVLSFTHDLPTLLIGTPSAHDGSYVQRFVAAVEPIMKQHHDECLDKLSRTCAVCSKTPSMRALQTPSSFLHMVSRPFISVICTPICAAEVCEKGARDGMQELHQEAASRTRTRSMFGTQDDGKDEDWEDECRTCRRLEGIKKCTGCEKVSYCSRECQKKHWKMHKSVCGWKRKVSDMVPTAR